MQSSFFDQGMKATAEELIEHTRQFLAGFKVPKSSNSRTVRFRCLVPSSL